MLPGLVQDRYEGLLLRRFLCLLLLRRHCIEDVFSHCLTGFAAVARFDGLVNTAMEQQGLLGRRGFGWLPGTIKRKPIDVSEQKMTDTIPTRTKDSIVKLKIGRDTFARVLASLHRGNCRAHRCKIFARCPFASSGRQFRLNEEASVGQVLGGKIIQQHDKFQGLPQESPSAITEVCSITHPLTQHTHAFQYLQSLPHGGSVHAECLGQLPLRRKLIPWSDRTACDPFLKFGDQFSRDAGILIDLQGFLVRHRGYLRPARDSIIYLLPGTSSAIIAQNGPTIQ